MGDDEILQLFYHRVEYAISAVEEKYGRLCRSVARGILKDERDVEECVNDTCMRAWNAIPPEKPRSLEAYLVRITRNPGARPLCLSSLAEARGPRDGGL